MAAPQIAAAVRTDGAAWSPLSPSSPPRPVSSVTTSFRHTRNIGDWKAAIRRQDQHAGTGPPQAGETEPSTVPPHTVNSHVYTPSTHTLPPFTHLWIRMQMRIGSSYSDPQSASNVAEFFQKASRVDMHGNITLDEEICATNVGVECAVYRARSNQIDCISVVSIVNEVLAKRLKRMKRKRLRDEKILMATRAEILKQLQVGRGPDFGMMHAACVTTFGFLPFGVPVAHSLSAPRARALTFRALEICPLAVPAPPSCPPLAAALLATFKRAPPSTYLLLRPTSLLPSFLPSFLCTHTDRRIA